MCSPNTTNIGNVYVQADAAYYSDTVFIEMRTPDAQKNSSYAANDYAWNYLSREDAVALRDHLTKLLDAKSDIEKEKYTSAHAQLMAAWELEDKLNDRVSELEGQLSDLRAETLV